MGDENAAENTPGRGARVGLVLIRRETLTVSVCFPQQTERARKHTRSEPSLTSLPGSRCFEQLLYSQLSMDGAFSRLALLAPLLLLPRAPRLLLLLLLLGKRRAPPLGIELSVQDLLLRQGGQPLDELRRRRLVPLHSLLGSSDSAARGPPG
jgi:hypothetical protein